MTSKKNRYRRKKKPVPLKNRNPKNDEIEKNKKNPVYSLSSKNVMSYIIYTAIALAVVSIIIFSFNKGGYWPDITFAIVSIILAFNLTLYQNIPKKAKALFILFTVFLFLHTAYKIKQSYQNNRLELETREYYNQSQERIELHSKGLSDNEIWNYNKDPLLKQTLKEANQDKANRNYEKAINKYKSCLRYPDISLESQHLINSHIAVCYSSLRRIDAAVYHWKLALEKAKEYSGNDMIKSWFVGRSYNGLGETYFLFEKYDSALENFKEGLAAYKNGGAIQGTASGYYNVGLAYHAIGSHDQAINHYYDCIDFSEKHHYMQLVPSASCNLAMALWEKREESYDKIINRFEKSINEAIAINDRECITRAAHFAGKLCFDYGQDNQSIKFNKQYIKYSSNKNKLQVGVAYGMIGNMYFRINDFEKSIVNYDKAQEICLNLNKFDMVVEALEYKGLAHEFIGRPYKALICWNEALDICNKNNFKERKKDIIQRIKLLKQKIE
ncbi:membrane hypothetical protein [Desulfosarcina cetonica]|uniref:tetratricopeptide repeat protein n=1 Tax=Desulfosarcina cetonica TaxID=90730 RepID=UPI0006D07D16|nr:tetratricopeptide repeat protein [Desulfosarcina cetonica]VTR66878.1 membrane hypothetical protein [Desulfosarcina cetonica]